MLANWELIDLYRRLREEDVLSVYLDADQHDPAQREAWRRRLNHLAARARGATDVASGERAAFDASLARVQERLDAYDAFLPGRGWIAFASPDRLWYAEAVSSPVPDMVSWGTGIRVAPLVRGLKQNRLVAALLLDRQRARLFRYRTGVLSEPLDMVAEVSAPELSKVRGTKRAATHSGVRGATRTDVAQCLSEMGAERLARAAVRRALELVGDDGYLVLGGTPEMVAAAARRLPKTMADRVLDIPSAHLAMPAAELKEALEAAASTLSQRRQDALLAEVLDAAGAEGRGAVGQAATQRALREGRVETLIVTRSFREREPELAEEFIGAALDRNAQVEEIAGPAADFLDAEGGGVAARLRYLPETSAAGAA